MPRLLLLILPTLTLAYIQIDIKGVVQSDNVISSNANPTGFEERVINDQDRTVFRFQDQDLKRGIEKINGKIPDEVYVIASNMPYDRDLYKTLGLKQVNVRIEAKKNLFFDVNSNVKKLSETKYENQNSRPKDTFINENGYLIDTTYSYWVNRNKVQGSDVNIRVSFHVDNNSVSFEKSFRFGVNYMYLEKTYYYEANTTLRLNPDQKVTAELQALKRTTKLEIPYEISLTGYTIAKYNEMYKDKYFHTFDINDVLKESNINSTYVLYQMLQYVTLHDAELHILDSNDIVLRTVLAETKVSSKGQKKATIQHGDKDKAEGVPIVRKKMTFEIPVNEEFVTIEDHEEESGELADKQNRKTRF